VVTLYRNLITSAVALCLGFALGFVVAQAVLK